MTKILTLSASNSHRSINRTLLNIALKKISHHEVKAIDIRDYPMPIYSIDVEQNEGFPEKARQLRTLFAKYEAFIIATPEHNGSMPAVFKNLIDWVSRLGDHLNPMFAPNKPVLLLSTSPGPNGGATNIQTLTQLMPWWGADVRDSYSLSSFHENFSDGKLNPDQDLELTQVIHKFVDNL